MLDRQGLQDFFDEHLDEMLVNMRDDVWNFCFRMTSGTSGRGPLLSINELGPAGKKRFLGFSAILNCFGGRNVRLAYVRNVCVQENAQPQRTMALDIKDETPQLGPILRDFAPDYVVGFPSFILRVAEHMDAETRLGVRLLECTGEMLTPALREQMKNFFPDARLLALYACADIGSMASNGCGKLPPNQYHPSDGVRIDIVDADERGVGEIVVYKRIAGFDIPGYRTGDSGRFTEACACGKPISFEILGRFSNDYIRLAGALLLREEFDRVLSMYKEVADYRAQAEQVVEEAILKGRVTLYIHGQHVLDDESLRKMAKDISEKLFVSRTQTYADLVAKGTLLPLVLSYAEKPFEKKYKTVKLFSKKY